MLNNINNCDFQIWQDNLQNWQGNLQNWEERLNGRESDLQEREDYLHAWANNLEGWKKYYEGFQARVDRAEKLLRVDVNTGCAMYGGVNTKDEHRCKATGQLITSPCNKNGFRDCEQFIFSQGFNCRACKVVTNGADALLNYKEGLCADCRKDT